MAANAKDQGVSREVDRSLLHLGFIVVLLSGVFPSGIMRRIETGGGEGSLPTAI